MISIAANATGIMYHECMISWMCEARSKRKLRSNRIQTGLPQMIDKTPIPAITPAWAFHIIQE